MDWINSIIRKIDHLFLINQVFIFIFINCLNQLKNYALVIKIFLVPTHWCAISYYEYDRKVGDTFQATSEHCKVFIDGGLSNSDGSRFCLGSLTNTVRTDAAEKCR